MRYLLAAMLSLVPMEALAKCGPAANIAAFLFDKYGEKPQISFAAEEILYTLYARREGWTLVGVKGDTACILTEGKAWKIHGAL